MAETTAEVRRDIELTRERMSTTLTQLEQKLNLTQVVKEHPWPAIALAVGAGMLLSGSRADVRATAATLAATRGTSSKLGPVLDDLVAQLMTGVQVAFQSRVESWVDEIKGAIGAPTGTTGPQSGQGTQSRQQFADVNYGSAGYGTGPTSHATGSTGPTGSAGTTGAQGTTATDAGAPSTIDSNGGFGRAD